MLITITKLQGKKENETKKIPEHIANKVSSIHFGILSNMYVCLSLCRSIRYITWRVNGAYRLWLWLWLWLRLGLRLQLPVRTDFISFLWFNLKLQYAKYVIGLLQVNFWIYLSDLCRFLMIFNSERRKVVHLQHDSLK